MKKIGEDTWQHFLVCLGASIIDTGFAIGLALGKEYGDSKAIGNKWDWKDILADAIGIVLGTAIRIGIKLLFF